MARKGLEESDLTPERLTRICVASLERSPANPPGIGGARVVSLEVTRLGAEEGVVSRFRSADRRLVGHFVVRAVWQGDAAEYQTRYLMKSRSGGGELRTHLEEVYSRIDPALARGQNALAPSLLDASHLRELAFYAHAEGTLRRISPRVHGWWRDDERMIYAVFMELLEDVQHLATLDDLDAWSDDDIRTVCRDIAPFHAAFLGRVGRGAPELAIEPFGTIHNRALSDYRHALLTYSARRFPTIFDAARTQVLRDVLHHSESRHAEILRLPLTIIHGDLTPRNLCLRHASGDAPRLCAYDWELAQVNLPQRDVWEFICYTASARRITDRDWIGDIFERYGRDLAAASGIAMRDADLRRATRLALEEFASWKLLVQSVSHQLLGKTGYFTRLAENTFAALEAFA